MSKKRKSRRKSTLLKGAYRLPSGGYVIDHGPEPETAGQKRRTRAIGVRREQPDLERIARALVADAIEQARREIEAEPDESRPAA